MTLDGLNDDFRDIVVLFADEGVEFVVVGAFALAFHSTRRKLSLLQLAEELGNVSKACKLMGSRGGADHRVETSIAGRAGASAPPSSA